jgi:hypothetical protein
MKVGFWYQLNKKARFRIECLSGTQAGIDWEEFLKVSVSKAGLPVGWLGRCKLRETDCFLPYPFSCSMKSCICMNQY